MTNSANVRDLPEESRFVYEEDGAQAELVYSRDGKRLILVHTEVPERLRSRGLGGELVRAALNQARAEDLTLVPWCPYARSWIRGHPEEVTEVKIDWGSVT